MPRRFITALLFVAQSLFYPHPSPAQSSMLSSSCPCTLQGSVVDAVSGQPVPHALVKLSSASPRAALTDSEGKFQFEGLPAGRVTLAAEKPGFLGEEGLCFVPCGISFQLGPDTPPATLKLIPEGVISGQVSDENGEPLEGFKVSVYFRVPRDKRLFEDQDRRHSVVTDDEGKFRIARLHPGSYFLHVSSTEGPVLNSFRKSAAPMGYSPVFYPGVNPMSSAVPLKLLPGQVAQANFSLKLEAFVQLSGTVSGVSPQEQVSMSLLDSAITSQSSEIPLDAATGTFHTKWIPPGAYIVVARSEVPRLSIATAHVNATSSHSGLRLVLQPTVEVPVVIHGLPDADSDKLQSLLPALELAHIPDDNGSVSLHSLHSPVNPETTRSSADKNMFFTGVLPGHYELDVESPHGSSFYIESASWGSTDLLRSGFVLASSGDIPPIEIVLHNDGATLDGVVSSRDFLSTVEVVLLNENRKRPQSMSVRDGGKFEFSGLAPGVYRVFAVDRSAALEYTDATFLAKISSKTREITLSPKQSASINLELATVEE
jgi:hypothetical protein